MCQLLVGLPDVTVHGVEGDGVAVIVHVELRSQRVACPSYGVVA